MLQGREVRYQYARWGAHFVGQNPPSASKPLCGFDVLTIQQMLESKEVINITLQSPHYML
jgi:hypothetical protein